jgi:hypothetical protein
MIDSTLLTGLVAAGIALLAWRTSDETLRNTYRPVIRPVPLWTNSSTSGALRHDALFLENIGTWPALSVTIVEDRRTSSRRSWDRSTS